MSEGSEMKGLTEGPGDHICDDLAHLPDDAVVTEGALARMFERSPKSIKRAVQRGELPPPVKILGKQRWLAGAIRDHIRGNLDEAARQAQQQRARFEGYRP